MKIGVLTSSRADFGIYLPLLNKLKLEVDYEIKLIVFGTHLSQNHGYTINDIIENGFHPKYQLITVPLDDNPKDISNAIGNTITIFSTFWDKNKDDFDLVFCLGDRYEMFAAVISGLAFQINFAHIHGGETTLGAIDNIFRHSISLSSKFHFVSTDISYKRVSELIQSQIGILKVGALSLDSILNVELLTLNEFNETWEIDLNIPTILTTFHPETVNTSKNLEYASILAESILCLDSKYQVLITMPNADTFGNRIREVFFEKFDGNAKIKLIENLGIRSYFTAMKYCRFLLGNTSSGIIEAASFGKFVIDLGDRQKGREFGNNVINIRINKNEILQTIENIENSKTQEFENIYYAGGAADKIVNFLKKVYK